MFVTHISVKAVNKIQWWSALEVIQEHIEHCLNIVCNQIVFSYSKVRRVFQHGSIDNKSISNRRVA